MPAPGDSVPPLVMLTAPRITPSPARVPPAATVTVFVGNVPLTTRVPPETTVVPLKVLVPANVHVPASRFCAEASG